MYLFGYINYLFENSVRGREKDSLSNALHRVSVFQSLHGSHDSGRLWNIAKRRNANLVHQIAREIVNFAIAYECDVIVMEHLDTKGKKRGSKKQKLAMWKHADIQKTVESLAHHYGIRISHVNAWGTSRLAYDGSGRVRRGREVSKDTPYDVCVFKSGKIYNCDLSASYNIGARYFIRGVFMESPNLMTKVSGIGSGTQRTLAVLWKINRVLYPLLPATV
ncbi:MAG: IS200/IS605 family accessory protein TnpB-related protein [Lactimicrobium massiliense]|nr:IS200/IS605 family accessory protein TnpB-related protein [Lactimicrobium massiliense]MDD6559818.1 IS200/IS605 family accessory protein TnpB-related protein [Lactimicrobium massiliense]